MERGKTRWMAGAPALLPSVPEPPFQLHVEKRKQNNFPSTCEHGARRYPQVGRNILQGMYYSNF